MDRSGLNRLWILGDTNECITPAIIPPVSTTRVPWGSESGEEETNHMLAEYEQWEMFLHYEAWHRAEKMFESPNDRFPLLLAYLVIQTN
jgi:hypothetical protein